jgi:hypothetical protein
MITDANEVFELDDIKSKKLRTTVAELLLEQARWNNTKKEAEEQLKAIGETLIPLLTNLGINRIVAPDVEGVNWKFGVVSGTNSHIDKMLLIQKGIDPDVVDACTKMKSYQFVTRWPLKGDE